MHVRLAGPADAEAIARLRVIGWRAAYRGIVPEDFLLAMAAQEESAAAAWRGDLADPGRRWRVVVAEDDSGVAGFASAGSSRDDDRPDALTLYAIYLDPRHWRAGLGTRLVDAVLTGQRTGSGAAGPVLLWVLEANVAARSFYERLGFTADGARLLEPFGSRELSLVRYAIPAWDG